MIYAKTLKCERNAVSGDELRGMRLDLGWTQKFLAASMGVSRSSLAHWEQERAVVPPVVARAITKVHKTVSVAIRGMYRVAEV